MTWRVPVGAWSDRAAFILGGGPSLADVDVERLRGRGRVIAVNDAGLHLAPWADVLFFADGAGRWWSWNHLKLDLFRGEHIITRAQISDPRVKRLRHDPKLALSDDPGTVAGFCGGSSCINLAHLFGAKTIILLGFDMRPGNWHANHRLPSIANCHRERFIPALERMAPELAARGVTVLNTNPRSALRCFDFAALEDLLALDDLARIEADKYRRIWQRPEYRRISPGALEAERAFVAMGCKPGESLTDFGAGTGRATAFFQGRGLSVLAVDHAENALETSVPFVNACLWEMGGAVPASDHGFCCDVMEHIPPAKVGPVLAAIRARCTKGVWFSIATRPDQMGALIQAKLHLTVQSGEWWRRQVEALWPLVDVIHQTRRDIILYARP